MSADRWVMVPAEPTPEMLKAAVVYANGNAVYKNVAAEALRIEESIYGEVYSAMLAAAPAAPAAQSREPLTKNCISRLWYAPGIPRNVGLSDFETVVRATERAHDIGGKA